MTRTLRALLFVLLTAPGVASAAGGHRVVPADLDFQTDSGIRIVDAGVPWAVMTSSGKVRLYVHSNGWKYTSSANGVDFGELKKTKNKDPYDPTRVKLHDGKWRRYKWDSDGRLKSEKSRDGVNFRNEWGSRYKLRAADQGKVGTFDIYKAKKDKVVLLYAADLYGVNNVRMAVSKNNGRKFKFKKGNPLGDKDAGGGPNVYIDQKSIKLSDGRRRLFTMKGGEIFTFISDDGGLNYEAEPGPVLQPSDFKALGVTTLHDPTVVMLADGRYRMYVGANIGKADKDGKGRTHLVLSATSRGPTP